MKLGKIFAKNLKALRIAKGLSQQALADKTGLTLRYLSKIENSDPNVTLDVLERLHFALDCSILDLLGEGQGSLGDARFKMGTKSLDEVIRFLQSVRSRQVE
jgi:transcriptional regulator with XRE-family HTH domain